MTPRSASREADNTGRLTHERSLVSYRHSIGHDLFTKASCLNARVNQLRATRTWGYRLRLDHREGGQALAETDFGERRWVIDGTSSDYLGLSADSRVTSAVVEAVESYGLAARGARMLGGTTEIHQRLERSLAGFLGYESALLTPSGFSALQGTCQALLTSTDVVFVDRSCNPAVSTGLRLSDAQVHRYEHLDMGSLERSLIDNRNDYRGALIVSEHVFGIGGTIAPIEDLVSLARTYGCRLLIDDSHGLAAINGGRGCAVHDGVDILAGSLAKGLGSGGGFIASTAEITEYLGLFAASASATSNLSVANAAGALAALNIVDAEPQRCAQLDRLVQRVRHGMRSRGLNISHAQTPILSVVVGRDSRAFEAWRDLFDDGLLTHALPFPIVAHGQAAIRIRLTTSMTNRITDRLVELAVAHFSDSSVPRGTDGLLCAS